MSLATARRGTALGLALTLAVAGTALADELKADADVLTGIQNSFNLGEVAPGAERSVNVDFVLSCTRSSHLTAGASIDIDEESRDIPADAELSVTPGEVTVPADWPADGAFCSGSESAATVTPATLDVTAPMTPGAGYAYTVFFVLSDGEATSNLIATTIYLDVVIPDGPVDTTGPVLEGMPSDVETTTTGASTVVTWTNPTATDDVDPAPTVGCAPPSGSAFDLGTTTVTCTATDATGNSSSATFNVTVRLAAPTLTGTWAKPLDAGVPALTGRAGRNIPLKLTVTAGDHAQGPADIAAPSLLVQTLNGCSNAASVTGMRDAGRLAWSGGAWQMGLDTNGLGSGCMRLVARVDGDTVATAIIELNGDGQPASAKAKR
jgi:HYR domain